MNRNENDKRTFCYMISLLIIVIITIVMISLQGCSNEEPIFEYGVIGYSNNLIKLESETMVVLDNGMGHFDKWFLSEGITFELIVHEIDDYVRFYDTPDFTVSSDRIYTVGEGRDHVTDFTALNPPVDLYYFSMDVIINGVSNTIDYVIDSN